MSGPVSPLSVAKCMAVLRGRQAAIARANQQITDEPQNEDQDAFWRAVSYHLMETNFEVLRN